MPVLNASSCAPAGPLPYTSPPVANGPLPSAGPNWPPPAPAPVGSP
ncbi:hypothetical protein LO762_14295 [Actinocorallia sp. API 0066]|nr:hypothetical protein [Actinocorallia sp. API 0066]